MSGREFELRPIGVVRSELSERDDAPKQGDEGAPDAWLELDGRRLRVNDMEAVDGTPIVDLKPVLDARDR
jgi:tRNA (Thr-GGU) A37 N-methylase